MRVAVKACARLHFGFYNIRMGGRWYGGIGVSVDKPCVLVEAEPSHELEAPSELMRPLQKVAVHYRLHGARIRVLRKIPRHVGLGSTTQLYLAASYAYLALHNMKPDPVELARILGRASISGIGLYSFLKGGFIIDAGKPEGCTDCIVGLVTRLRIPERWRFIVVVPENRQGLTEEEEKIILDNPQPMAVENQYQLYGILLTGLLPALVEDNPEAFGRKLNEYQKILGEYYSKHQGGIFSTAESELAARLLLQAGAYGVGQSSWGPAVYGVSDKQRARQVASKLLELLRHHDLQAKVFVARPRNWGAKVKMLSRK